MEVEDFSAEALQKRLDMADDSECGAEQALTLRERFRRAMFYQEVAPLPNFEFGYWDRTLAVWRTQGLPDWVTDEAAAYRYFGIENWVVVPVDLGPAPVCEHTVLEETDDRIVYRDTLGVVAQVNKHGDQSIPHFLDFPVKDRATWAPYKAALDPDTPGRYAHVDAALPRLLASGAPIIAPGGSLVGIPRNLIGFEHVAVLPYEDPELFQEIVDTFGHLICTALERVLPRIQVDACMGWEDICFNQGPVVNPRVFAEVAGPWYRRISELLVRHGCCVYTTDTDGNLLPIVETFLDNGLNTLFPVEVHAGTDPVVLRERYGRRVRLWGGVDKMALIAGKDAIDAELQRIRPCVEQGGFLPGVDHRVPADVPLDHYKHYMDRKREWFGVGGEPLY